MEEIDMKVNILIVETDLIVALDLEQELKLLGYNIIETVSSGEAAFKTVKNSNVDLIFMDTYLNEELNGIETAVQIRNDHKVPIIYVTSITDIKTYKKIEQTKPYEYIKKPFDNVELQIAINNIFKQ